MEVSCILIETTQSPAGWLQQILPPYMMKLSTNYWWSVWFWTIVVDSIQHRWVTVSVLIHVQFLPSHPWIPYSVVCNSFRYVCICSHVLWAALISAKGVLPLVRVYNFLKDDDDNEWYKPFYFTYSCPCTWKLHIYDTTIKKKQLHTK